MGQSHAIGGSSQANVAILSVLRGVQSAQRMFAELPAIVASDAISRTIQDTQRAVADTTFSVQRMVEKMEATTEPARRTLEMLARTMVEPLDRLMRDVATLVARLKLPTPPAIPLSLPLVAPLQTAPRADLARVEASIALLRTRVERGEDTTGEVARQLGVLQGEVTLVRQALLGDEPEDEEANS